MSRPFCKTPLWDSELTWNTETPDFTSCLENTLLIYIPTGVVAITSVPYVVYLRKWSTNSESLPLTRLGAIKSILSLLLAFLCLMNFFRTVSEEVSGLEPEVSLFLAPWLQSLTLIWTVALMRIERNQGVINSGPLFVYWLLMTICGLPQIYSYALKPDQNDVYRIVVHSIYYALVIIQLIASCIVDVVPSYLLKDPKQNPELSASFLSYITFHWINKLCWTGFKKTLTIEDVFKLHPRDRCEIVVPLLEEAWQVQLQKSRQFKSQLQHSATYGATETVTISVSGEKHEPKLYKALASAFGLRLLFAGVLKLVYDVTQFLAPFILQWMIDYTTNSAEPTWHGYVYAIALFAANLLGSVMFHQCIQISIALGMNMKSSLIALTYKKSLAMTSSAKKKSPVGEIVNLMSIDADRVQNQLGFLHMLVSAPFQIVVAMVLLWNTMGTSTLAGLAIMIVLIPWNGFLARYMHKMQEQQMKFKDSRIRILSEIISGIKILKLYAWEPSFHDQVKEIREQELIMLRKAAFMNSLLNFTWVTAPYLVMLATFMTYIYGTGQPLTPDKAFVALSLFNILRTPLSMLPEVLAYTAQALVSVKRIGNFIGHPDLDAKNVERNLNSKTKTAFEVRSGTFSWGADEQPSLHDINLKVTRGKLVAIVGPVGSGKSSLLSALLGDMDKIKGQVVQNGSLSYVAQQAWIQNATIKDNILFAKDFNQKLYEQVIEACALKSDLQILTDGDQTEIGEKGINLSGGQKQRVALARAVYQDRDIILLDDPLSAVDAHVGKHIFESVIGPKGVLKGKTRILVTHGLHWLPHCDEIVVIADGRITDHGTFQELLTRGGTFAEYMREHLTEAGGVEAIMSEELSETAVQLLRQISSDSTEMPPRTPTTPGAAKRFGSVSSPKVSISESMIRKRSSLNESQKSQKVRKSSTKLTPAPAKLIEEEFKAAGGVPLPVMKAYLSGLGKLLLTLWFGFYLVSQGFAVFGSIWLTEWTSDPLLMNVSIANTSDYLNKQSLYLGLYGMSAAGQAIFMLIHSLLFAISCVNASRIIHSRMLDCILHCAMSFFDTTPIGRILNRFSKDCDTIDNFLPQNLWVWIAMAVQILTTVIVIIYGFPLFAAFIVPLGVFFYLVQRFYIPTTRQLKRIESVTRSPIYSHFSETLSGVATIRAFGEQYRFIDESSRRVDHNNISYYASNSSNRWLGFRLEQIGNFTVFATCMLAILYRGTTSSSVVGLSISYALQITIALTWLVRMSSDLESNFVSVERMDEYSKLQGEASWQVEPKPDPKWPQNGGIVFDQYATRYRPGLQLVLNGISCQIKPGEKVGIVGRTGAGKSSLTLALFRLIESAGGRIVIDGLDISKLGLHELRSKLTILPQDPVIFSGSVRHNIDPFSKHSDEQLWKALENAGLREFVSSTEKALEHECGENGESLSVGQRQLLCLARALLNKTKVLVLDEATAAVDVETDEQIMTTIRTEFSDCTVLIIAHRLNTVMDSDRVLVLDKGQIAEFDSPQTLLSTPNSIFASMAQSSKALSQNDILLDEAM